MSQANSDRSPFGDQPQQHAPRYRKPRPDLYTMLLVIAWIAILLAILVLYLELSEYNFEFTAARAMPAAPALVRAAIRSGTACEFEDGCRARKPDRHDRC